MLPALPAPSRLLTFVLLLTLAFSPLHQVQYDMAFVVEGDLETPIPHLKLTLTDAAGLVIDTFTTDENGSFAYGDLAPGHYVLRVLTDGFLKPFPYFIPSQLFTFEIDGETPPPMVLALLPLVTSDISQFGHAPFLLPESADGDRAAFYTSRLNSDAGQPAELFTVTAPGEFAQIGSETADDYDPALSPDAARIAFTSNRDDGDGSSDLDLYVMNYDGTAAVNVIDDTLDNFDPAWSPDGERLVFITESGTGDQHLYVIDADGDHLAALTSGSTHDYSPSWSPDGTRITFASTRSGSYDIYVINADGTGLTALTSDPTDEFDPVWSPDGTQIVFSAYRDRNTHEVSGVEVRADGTLASVDIPISVDSSIRLDPYRNLSLFSVWTVDLATGESAALELALSESCGGRFAPEFMVYGIGRGWNVERLAAAALESAAAKSRKPALTPDATLYWNGIPFEPLLGEYVRGWGPGGAAVWSPVFPFTRFAPPLDPIINNSNQVIRVDAEYDFTASYEVFGNLAYARSTGLSTTPFTVTVWIRETLVVPPMCEVIVFPYFELYSQGVSGEAIVDSLVAPRFREKLGFWSGLYYPQSRFGVASAVFLTYPPSHPNIEAGLWINMYPLENIAVTRGTQPPGSPIAAASGIGFPTKCTYATYYIP
jgi:hypothetical protein